MIFSAYFQLIVVVFRSQKKALGEAMTLLNLLNAFNFTIVLYVK